MTTAAIPTPSAFCHACGTSLDPRAEICVKCGVRQRRAATTGRSRTSAAVFALFLGGLGAHKFYLGQPGLGVLYLLFCWTLVPSVVALIEGILYLTMSDEDFAAKHGG